MTKSKAPRCLTATLSIMSVYQPAQLKKNSKNTFNFGAVVYRDFAEKSNLVRVSRLSDNYWKAADFLKNTVAEDKYDQDTPEAVFYGLKTALKSVGWSKNNKNETNILDKPP